MEARSPDQTLRTPDLDPSSRPGTGAEPVKHALGTRFTGEYILSPSPGTWSDFHDLQPDAREVIAPLGPGARMPEHAQQKRFAGNGPAQRGTRAPGCVWISRPAAFGQLDCFAGPSGIASACRVMFRRLIGLPDVQRGDFRCSPPQTVPLVL